MNEKKEIPFEAALARLEEVVNQLEQGETPLEEAISLFDEGMKLAHHCGQKLDWAEQKIEMLLDENNQLMKKPFQPEEDIDD